MKNNPSNKLGLETSPYLLQHANNPVNWYSWCKEAFEKAQREDKPVLVSIGYATCHWCHVMERESFEDEAVASFMNAHFICIKVDKEERPDIDAIYMEAVQLIHNGQGGWPLNCFLLPDKRPFYGGTYYPPQQKYNRPSWIQVLRNIAQAFVTKRAELQKQAAELSDLIAGHSNPDRTSSRQVFEKDTEAVFQQLYTQFDATHGGFGQAPKFPCTEALRFCLNYYHLSEDPRAIEVVDKSLLNMCLGGIYDHVDGGFSRYTVDQAWVIPHFEKMLYDNALIIQLLSETYKIKPNALYKDRIQASIQWLEKEMYHSGEGFFSAIDADSEGVEGKFYTWTLDEVQKVLKSDTAFFERFYNLSEEGNWEGTNILHILPETFKKQAWSADEQQQLSVCLSQLQEVRSKRIPPQKDDKILMDWNALMVTAYCCAFEALGTSQYKDKAIEIHAFLMTALKDPATENSYFHSYKNGKAKIHAFLDDYVFLLQATLALYKITQKVDYLESAKTLADHISSEFKDHKDGLYFFTSAKQTDILVHKKMLYDSSTPSSNAVLADCFQALWMLTENEAYRSNSNAIIEAYQDAAADFPVATASFRLSKLHNETGWKLLKVQSEGSTDDWNELLSEFLPNTVLTRFSLPGAYKYMLCDDKQCYSPVSNLSDLKKLL